MANYNLSESNTIIIRGQIRDIQPNKERPTLELSFSSKDSHLLPQGARAVIILDLNGKFLRGTINSSGRNSPYIHTRLTNEFQQTLTCTQVFLNLCLIEGAIIDFEYSQHKILRIYKVIDSGKWRIGNEPEKRKLRSNSVPIKPKKRVCRATYFNGNQSEVLDVEKLEDAIKRDFSSISPSTDRAWSRSSALRVIDCVLSLNRRYDSFVVPRLDHFERDYPEATSVRNLKALIEKYQTELAFMQDALDYNDSNRARILKDVVDFTLSKIGNTGEDSEISMLEQWARDANPEDYVDLRISGFALAGFQYLRMLFGANTTKPDIHIRGYVAEIVGHNVSDLYALRLLERVAEGQGISLRDIDTNIWESRAR